MTFLKKIEENRKNQLKQNDKIPKILYIDEIAHKKGQGQFMTIISDGENIREIVTGKSSEEIIKKLLVIPHILEVKKVCVDMCSSFTKAIKAVIPNAEIVSDRFHIIKLLIKYFWKLNKKSFKNLDKEERKRFSKIRYLLSKDRRHLKKWGKRLIKDYLQLNKEMKCVYWKIQGFRRILFSYKGYKHSFVSEKLTQWIIGTEKYFGQFVETLKRWWDQVINACVYKDSNARQEGINNKIKSLKRRGFGYRNWLNFEYRIYGECNP